MSKLLEKVGIKKYSEVHPDGTADLMGIWGNMFSQAEPGSEVRWVETPRDVYRFMQHPEYTAAMNRGVKVSVILVQTELPKQETFFRAIRDGVSIVRAYDDRLHEINRVTGLSGVMDYIQKTWNFVFQSKTEDLDINDAYRLAVDWKHEFFPDGKVSYELALKTPSLF